MGAGGALLHQWGRGWGKAFLDSIPKIKVTKERIDTLDFTKIKDFCTSKETIRKVKRQSTEWGKIFAHRTCNRKRGLEYVRPLPTQQQKWESWPMT